MLWPALLDFALLLVVVLAWAARARPRREL